MSKLNQADLDQIFEKARTHYHWQNKSIDDSLLVRLYDLLKWAPTSANGSPGRFVFIRTKEQKQKLITCLDPANVEKTATAPVTVIIAQDLEFYEKLPQLLPHADAKSWFAGNEKLIEETAFRNSSLQGAYLILAARSLGLDVGPMSGFDRQKVDQTFLSGTSWRSNFLCNLGYGDPLKLYPRSPRLSFEQACQLL